MPELSAPELSLGRRRAVLAVCCLSLFMVGLDNTIVNLALPSIRRDFGASVSSLQWTIDAYTLVLASLLMLSGSTGDRLGRRRTFQTGLVLFSIGSLLCGIAPNVGSLIAFRALQAVGGSMLNPVALSIITNIFTEPRERARAIGVWAGVAGLSMAVGPVVGGALVGTAGWRSIFWINVPVGLAALVLTAVLVPESRAPRPRGLDPVGQLLVIAVLAGVTYGIIEGRAAGWTSPEIIGAFVLAAVSVIMLVPYERRRADPLLELRFFRSAPFSGAMLIAIGGFSALAGFLFLNTLYLQETRGFSALEAGLLTLPMAAMNAVLSPVSGRMLAARGARLPLFLSGAAIALAGAALTTIGPRTPILLLVLVYAVFGAGFGMLNTPVTDTAVSGMPRAQAGVAAAVASTSRQVGISFGVAVIGAVAAAQRGPSGTGGGWWVVAGCGVLVVALGLVTTGRWARATAERARAGFAETVTA